MADLAYAQSKIRGVLERFGEADRLKILRSIVTGTTLDRRPEKLIVGVPVYWMLPAQFITCFAELLNDLNAIENLEVDVLVFSSAYIDFSRNDIVRKAHERKASHVLFLDQDVTFPPDLYRRLRAHDVQVVGALYHQKLPPFTPLIYDWAATPGSSAETWNVSPRLDYEDGLLECGAIGMGATLIRMDAFEKILHCQHDYVGEDGSRPFADRQFLYRQVAPVGEDVWFAGWASRAGVKIHCDTALKLGHVGLLDATETHYRIASRYGSLENALQLLEEAEMRAITGGDTPPTELEFDGTLVARG